MVEAARLEARWEPRSEPPSKQGFSASIGDAAYDAIRFSERPQAQLISGTPGSISIVRHLGTCHDGIVFASSAPALSDVLLLNITTGGRYRGCIGEARVDFPLQRGQLSFIPGNLAVDIEYPASNSVLLMMLPPALTGSLLAELGTGPLSPMHSERNDRLAQLFAMAEREMVLPGFASALMIDGLLRAIVTILARRDRGPPRGPARVHLPPVKLRQTMEFIEAELGRSISLDEIAAVAGLSPFHFSRVFKLATGETPYHYLGSRRLALARQLLARGKTSLAEIALACGFASQSHFTAAFTKGVGMSPGRYRRQAAG